MFKCQSNIFDFRSVVVGTVLFDSNSIVDISQIQNTLITDHSNKTNSIISLEMINKAENQTLFWMLILLALLIAFSISTLLFCCICSWCPLYAESRKRTITLSSSKDNVRLVHKEVGADKHSKSVQVADWIGRREAWSAESLSSSQLKSTHRDFRRYVKNQHNLYPEHYKQRVRSADDKRSFIRCNMNYIRSSKEKETHDTKTNLNNDRDIYVEDIIDHNNELNYNGKKKKAFSEQQVDDDSLRRHEIDRGSDIGYDQRSNMQRQLISENEKNTNRDHLYIKDGNAEILRLVTRGKQDEENIYVNVPHIQLQPQYIMVDNSGKEILMKRFFEEQSNGKQVIREPFHVLSSKQVLQSIPNEVIDPQQTNEFYVNKSPAGSAIFLQNDSKPKNQLKHNIQQLETQRTYSFPNQLIIQQELETSLKQQNALLRQILLEKANIGEKNLINNQQEVVLETQSLPGHAMAIATQTDCETGTQTDEPYDIKLVRRRARSENDDSMSESDYDYIRYSKPNSPEGVYWTQRKRPKKKSTHRDVIKPRRRIVMVQEIKRKIRTPIEEENEYLRSPVKRKDVKSNTLKRIKNDRMEISDSLVERTSPLRLTKRNEIHKYLKKQVKNYDDCDELSDDDLYRKRTYSEDSLKNYSEVEESKASHRSSSVSKIKPLLRRGSSVDIRDVYNNDEDYVQYVSDSIASTPAVRKRFSQWDQKKDAVRKKNVKSHVASERSHKHPTSKIPMLKSSKTPSTETDMFTKIKEDSSLPKYMEWYYNKNRSGDSEKTKGKSKISNKNIIGSTEQSMKAKIIKDDGQSLKPKPLPQSILKDKIRMLKEDMQMNKTQNLKVQTVTNHPLLQYSEHRYEHEYNTAPSISIPPTKLPYYIYPETPPHHSATIAKPNAKLKKKQSSPIKENEVNTSGHKATVPVESAAINPNQSKQLNASTLEDDLDSGIAMNSFLNSIGRRNPITDKKSVFTIAFDDVKVKKIQSESDSPQFS